MILHELFTDEQIAYISEDGQCYILTGCTEAPGRQRLHYRHKIKLTPTQQAAIGVVGSRVGYAQGRIIKGLAAVLEPADTQPGAEQTQGEICACCGENPAAEGDKFCAGCRYEIGEPVGEPPTLRPYSNAVCPICYAPLRPAVQCPRAQMSVCMDHCFNPPCEHLEDDTSLIRCTYLSKWEKEKNAV